MKWHRVALLILLSLHIEGAVSRQEVLAGERFTVDGYLFNDGEAAAVASLGIQAPAGFVLEHAPSPEPIPTLAPHTNLHRQWVYRVGDAAPGIYTFLVIAFDNAGFPTQATPVLVRVQPVIAPPARPPRVFLPVFRA